MKTHNSWTLVAINGLVAGTALLAPSLAIAGDADEKAKAKPSQDLATLWETSDAPLTFAGITIYGTVDLGYSSLTHGAPESGLAAAVEPFFVTKYSNAPFNGIVANPLDTSKLGIKGTEKITDDWNLIFKAETGFNPLDGHLVDGLGSVARSNGFPNNVTQYVQDSSRSGQIFQGALWGGLSNKQLGTLTYGRQNGILYDTVQGGDPMGGAYAFGLIGFTSSIGGAGGDGEDARLDNSLRYANTIGDKGKGPGAFRVGAEYQFGDEETSGLAWQGDVGYDYKGLSLDAAFARKDGALAASTLSNTLYQGTNYVKATLSDNTAWAITAKYDGGKDNYKLFGGYENISQGNSSNPESLGVGSQILGTQYAIGTGGFVNNAFDTNKVQQLWWVGGKYNFLPNLAGTVAYYHVDQNAYLADVNGGPVSTAPLAGTSCDVTPSGKATTKGLQNTASANCKGSEYAVSFLLDYQWTKRIDIYGGAMYSKARGGYTSGFYDSNADNATITVGSRLKF